MSTGISSWTNPAEITAMYPFVGTEVLLVILGFAFWIGWHIKQIRDENRELDKQAAHYRKIGLQRAMHYGALPKIASEQEVQASPAAVTVSVEGQSATEPGVEPAASA